MVMKKRFRTALALWGMARPLILVSVVLVYVNGLLIARAYGHEFTGEKILWGFVSVILIAASIHYTNEYADYETDALTVRTFYSGGSGILPLGYVPRTLALQAAWVVLILGFAIAVLGYWLGFLNVPALLCLALGAFGGWMYSLPPLKLAWRGWGELDNALLGGLLLHIHGYSVLSPQITLEIVLVCLPFTLLTFNNLLATTWADKEADAQVGKYTLATRLAVSTLRHLYTLVAIAAFALLTVLHGWVIPEPVIYASFLALPLAIWGWRTYTRIHAPYPTSNAMVMMLLAQMVAWYRMS
jgi:1,4-dihydroxy-2-naphthoate polyprenyltransferase